MALTTAARTRLNVILDAIDRLEELVFRKETAGSNFAVMFRDMTIVVVETSDRADQIVTRLNGAVGPEVTSEIGTLKTEARTIIQAI